MQPEQPEPDCNWIESYNMKVTQAEEKEAQFLLRWLDEEKPAHPELRLDPAIHASSNFAWLKECVTISDLMTLAYGHCDCLPPGFSGGRSLRVTKTHHRLDIKVKKNPFEMVYRSFYWYGFTSDVLDYVVTCAVCGISKKFCRKSRAGLQ